MFKLRQFTGEKLLLPLGEHIKLLTLSAKYVLFKLSILRKHVLQILFKTSYSTPQLGIFILKIFVTRLVLRFHAA